MVCIGIVIVSVWLNNIPFVKYPAFVGLSLYNFRSSICSFVMTETPKICVVLQPQNPCAQRYNILFI